MGIATVNGIPVDEWNIKQAAWQEKMAVRLPVDQFDMRNLVNHLLSQHWQHECVIELHRDKFGDRPPYWTVSWKREGDEAPSYLRYSHGPGTGTFWDCYGDDFHSPELALVELSKAYAPPRIDHVIPTHGR